jgi:hypothetical protein
LLRLLYGRAEPFRTAGGGAAIFCHLPTNWVNEQHLYAYNLDGSMKTSAQAAPPAVEDYYPGGMEQFLVFCHRNRFI